MRKTLSSQGGQIIFEYVLILVVTVTIALLITNQMVSRDANNPGFLIQKWSLMMQTIGADYPDGANPQN